MAAPTNDSSSEEPPIKDNITSLTNIQVKEVIGNGAYSKVYKAIDLTTDEFIALKCFRPEMRDSRRYGIASKEIAMLKILNHPNIVSLRHYECNRTYLVIGMEYLKQSLKEYKRSYWYNTEVTIQKIMKQLMSGLDYMHTLGIVHGDLKPQNIMLKDYLEFPHWPEIKICDFGLSEIKVKNIPLRDATGTMMFMAPEVLAGQPVDMSTDIWSAGAIMHFLLYNCYLFRIITDKYKIKYLLRHKEPLEEYLDKLINHRTGRTERVNSDNCSSFLRGLLAHSSYARLRGDKLRSHPFLNIDPQFSLSQKDEFLMKAKTHISSAVEFLEKQQFGDALVDATRSVIELKIHYNFNEDEDKSRKRTLRRKWHQYESFIYRLNRTLVVGPPLDLKDGTPINDEQLRDFLASTPKLLNGFDIGCSAEMYAKEGNVAKALEMFNEALLIILPMLKNEPKSNRKQVLGLRVKKWIEYMESLTKSGG